MLKSKLGIKNNKDKDTNSTSNVNVNNKDNNNVHSKSLKKLLNAKSTGHNILNSIKPIKPKGSLYDISNIDKNEEQIENDDENDSKTLAISSPKTQESVDLDNKITTKVTEDQNLNKLNDTLSSQKNRCTPSVTSKPSTSTLTSNSISKNKSLDSIKTHSSNANNTKNISNSTPNININTSTNKTITKSNSSFLAVPKSPIEAFSKFKSSDNIGSQSQNSSKRNSSNFLSVPDLNNKDLSNSLSSQASSLSSQTSESGLNKSISKKLLKKEKKETSSMSKDSKRSSSLFSSIGKYFKNKATNQLKENKKSKERIELTEDASVTHENSEKEKDVKVVTEKQEMKIVNPNLSNIETNEEDLDAFDPECLKTPKPKEEVDEEDEKLNSKRVSLEFTPKFKSEVLPSMKINPKRISTSTQSMTLVENQVNSTKSKHSSMSSITTQPIPNENAMKMNSLSTSVPLSEDHLKITNDDGKDETKVKNMKEGNRNSLNIESTITEAKTAPTSDKKVEKLHEVPTSSQTEDFYTTTRPELKEDQEGNINSDILLKNEEKSLAKQHSFEVKDDNNDDDDSELYYEDTSVMDESIVLESDHNILASSPRLSIASPYNHSNYSTSAAVWSPNQEKKRFNLFIPKAPSAIGLVTTPSNSTHNTSMGGSIVNNVSASLDGISMALMEEPMEERRCPYCHCAIVNESNYRPFEPTDNMSFEEDKSYNSSSRFSSASKLSLSPKLSPHSIAIDKLDNSGKTTTNNSHHYGKYLGSGGPGSIVGSVAGSIASSASSSKDYSHSINSSYTFSTVTTTSEEDCECNCHDARYHHPSFHVYHTKQSSSQDPPSSQASVSGMSFNSYQSRFSNISGYTADSVNKIFDKRSYCSTSSSFSLASSLSRANSLFFGGFNNKSNKSKNMRRKDFSKSTREIGRGATCVVKLVHKINDPSMLFALKEYKLSRVKENIDERTFLKHLRNEYQIGSLLHHPNIIETYAFLMTKTHNHKRRKYFVVLEYCEGGDLFNTIESGHLGTHEINCNFKQLMDGVNYLHSLGVAHCDIKPENILIKNVSQLKIIDFGTSEIFKYPYTPDTIKKSKGVKGSKPYIAPEQFQKSEYDPRASDIWSCAIVYIASLFDELPWRVASLEDFDFLRWKKERRNDLIRHIPDGPRQLITQMLNPDPEKRITMEQIYENEWFASIKTCISGEVQCHDKKHKHIQTN